MKLVCDGFCLQAVTALQDTSTDIKRKDGTRKIIFEKNLIPGSDLVPFLNEGN